MDRKTRAAAILALAALSLLALAAADTGGASAIRASRWLAKDADLARALGTVESECLRPVQGEQAYLVEVGRAAFRTPLLLGGQAARAGIACDTCHQGGRRNADFQFPGLSGAPGTADVTTALFSSHRDDGIDNPRFIPDLSGPKSRLRVSQDPSGGALESFIHGQITEEFNGAEPPPVVLKGLAAYVRALGPQACLQAERHPLRPVDYVDDAARAAGAADQALARHDPDTAVLMLAAARSRMGLLYERYDQPQAAALRADLVTSDEDLAAIQASIRSGTATQQRALAVWLIRLRKTALALAQEEPNSLFSQIRLSKSQFGTALNSQ